MPTTTERCKCVFHWRDDGSGLGEYVREPGLTCSAHGEADTIMMFGRYTDRRGREWTRRNRLGGDWYRAGVGVRNRTPAEMKLLIVREQHRDKCRTCRYDDGEPEDWPCAELRALEAVIGDE